MRWTLPVAALCLCCHNNGDPPAAPPDTGPGPTTTLPAPNVVLLWLDDVGYTGFASERTSRGLGSDYHLSPRFDALAEQSVAFDAAYVSPQCQPSRAALLTGQHAARTELYANFDANRLDAALRAYDAPVTTETLKPELLTIAEALKTVGYRTGSFGKWHIGADGFDGPSDQGFDVNVGGTDDGSISGGSDGHFAKSDGAFQLPGMQANGIAYQFAADRITDEALAFLDADLTQPAFVYLTHWSAHTPIMSPDDASAQYASQPPGAWHSDPTYGGMITNLDGNIGRVVDYLETTEDPRNPGGMLIDNTLLIVMSDNGAAGGYVAEGADTRDVSNQLPLRSGKGTLWEGGMRVPLVVRWDRAGSGGRIVDTPVQHIDVFPTITDLAGATVDPSVVIDGESLRPLFAANQGTLSRSQIFFHFPAYLEYPQTNPVEVRETPGSVVWDDRWKLIWRYETATWELYDVDADIAEQNQVAASHPDVVAELGQHLVDWLVETDASLPQYKGTTDEVPLPDPSAI